MKRNAATAAVVLALLLAGIDIANARSRDDILNQELLQLLTAKGWLNTPPDARPDVTRADEESNYIEEPLEYHDNDRSYDDEIRSEKRSAVATALNAGRRRRQPTPALGKAVTPFLGVGVLSNMDSFFDTLAENVKTIHSLSPEERSSYFPDPPTVLNAPGSGGGGSGMNKIIALRPIKPGFGNIRSYKRRSYPGAVGYDPRTLWIGLGR